MTIWTDFRLSIRLSRSKSLLIHNDFTTVTLHPMLFICTTILSELFTSAHEGFLDLVLPFKTAFLEWEERETQDWFDSTEVCDRQPKQPSPKTLGFAIIIIRPTPHPVQPGSYSTAIDIFLRHPRDGIFHDKELMMAQENRAVYHHSRSKDCPQGFKCDTSLLIECIP